MKVYIAQLLCLSRHCVVAGAGVYPDEPAAQELKDLLTSQFSAMVHYAQVDPFCGLCKSRVLTVEVRPTVFATMEEATPFLKQLEQEQRRTREYFGATKN